MATSSTTPLHSDHINYLVFRYLQENGHEDSATQFAKDWYRPREFREPEHLPFAPSVERNELIAVVQSGLRYDDLQARLGRNERQHRWTLTGDARLPRESVEVDEQWQQAPQQREREASRPLSSGKRKVGPRASTGGPARAQDDFPTPAPKRQRTGHGDDDVHVNGDRDAMDVDAMSASGAEDAEGEVVSPAAASDDVAVTIPERYDSMDVAVQTDIATGPKASTLSFTVPDRAAQIMHCSFHPSPRDEEPDLLLVTGQDLCKLYKIPKTLDDATPDVGPLDILSGDLPPGSVITASTWHPTDTTLLCVIEPASSGERPQPVPRLLGLSLELGIIEYQLINDLLEPPGMALHVSYSPHTHHPPKRILVLQSNLERSAVQIFNAAAAAHDDILPQAPCAWATIESSISTAEWMTDTLVMVAGTDGVSMVYELHDTEQANPTALAPNATQHNLIAKRKNITSGDAEWTAGACHRGTGSISLLSSTDHRLVVTQSLGYKFEDGLEAGTRAIDLLIDMTSSAVPTCMALDARWAIEGQARYETPALGFEDGTCTVYSTMDHGGLAGHEELGSIQLSEPVRALAWRATPDVLAVAGLDVVKFYSVVSDIDRNPVLVERPLLTWRPPHVETDVAVNGASTDDNADVGSTEPSLSWSADGSRLAFAIDKEVHIIYFRPSLADAMSALPAVNGAST